MATARPRPQVMRLTDAAALRIKDVMARAERPVAGLDLDAVESLARDGLVLVTEGTVSLPG